MEPNSSGSNHRRRLLFFKAQFAKDVPSVELSVCKNNRLLVGDSRCFSVGLALALLFLYSWLAIGFIAPIIDLVTASMHEVYRVWRGLPT